MLLLLLYFIYFTFALATESPSVCMNQFFIVNLGHLKDMSSIGITVSPVDSCLSQIPNGTLHSLGVTKNVECYIHESFLEIQNGPNGVSRCGECLEMTGPSIIPTQCVVTGTFKVTQSDGFTEDDLKKMILVPENLFTIVSTPTLQSNTHFAQVTLRESDCDTNKYTTIKVVEKHESTVTITFLNQIFPIKSVLINDVEYFHTTFGRFKVPLIKEKIVMKTFTFDGRVAIYDNINLNTLDYDNQFNQISENKRESCLFIPSNNVYVNNSNRELNYFFKWSFHKVNPDLSIISLKETDESIHFTADQIRTTFGIGYPTVIKMYVHFSQFSMDFEVKNCSTPPTYVFGTIGYGSQFKNDIKDAVFVCTGANIQPLVVTTKIGEGSYRIRLKFGIPKTCYGYLNSIGITFANDIGTIYDVKQIDLIPKMSSKQALCGMESFTCGTYECNPENLTVNSFKPGCVPNCGSCRSGYVCSNGKCMTAPSNNIRDSTDSIFIFFCYAIILFLL
ncbi:hypothetical protein EIN_253320 [Entamoeba invadens IP1]|uniref:Uncharacterized protein n=1 Tax=Entamoeba invadens IP1 TaxID=370355 RepID=A0A0A1UF13_ENTIV|nr:hypothetical protein EIN_253320 [Entamoeba invadens IP1]ELP95068.1 hypothetical protein EIN_253320 [Entamoeba invadens IP1]|eukprot:XP_004261839.1 hypothetical protein EIN_253320 [Entamoeba invadens IP1]